MKLRRNYAQLVVVAVTVLAPLIANAATAFLGSTLKRFNALPREERKKQIREALSTYKARVILGPNAVVARQVIKSDVAFEALLDTLESFSGEATKAGGEIARATARETIAQVTAKKNPTIERGRIFRLGASEGKERARQSREAYTRSRGVAKAGTPDYFASIRSPKRTEMTETALYFVPGTQDPDGKGYFLLAYDPRRVRTIQRLTQKVGGWQHVPSVTHVQLESLVELSVGRGGKVQRTAPAVHRVISMGRGLHAVVGPRASDRDVFGDRKEADKHAKDLDVKAASGLIPEVHRVVKTAAGAYRVDGPRADDVEFTDYTPETIRRKKAESEKHWAAYNKRKEEAPRGVKVPFEMTKTQELVKEWSFRGPFETKAEAARAAKNLDRMEATSGATPIAAKRTKVNAAFNRALEKAQETILAFYEEDVPLRVMWQGGASPTPAPAPRVTKVAKPSQFHGIPYRVLREALAEEDFTEEEIDEIILEERKNRALVEAQAGRGTERQLQLEAQRAGRLPRRRTAARKEVE